MTQTQFLTSALSASLLLCASSPGETIVQTVGNIDWNAAMWGNPAAVPAAGNDYVTATGVASNTVRISAAGTASTFPGNSLTVVAGTRALLKNQNNAVSTMAGDLILDGGRLSHAPNSGPHAATLDVNHLVVSGTGSLIDINGTSTFTIDAILTGSGNLLLKPELSSTAAGTVSFTGISGFTGTLTVQAPVRLDFGTDHTFTSSLILQGAAVLNVDQSLTFEHGNLVANGVIIPAGTYTGLDLTALGANFVDAGGTVNVVVTDTDGDGLPDWYEDQIINFDPDDDVDGYEDVDGPNNVPAASDFDGDGLSDAAEFADGDPLNRTDPTKPDTDGDGLLDGPEVYGTDNAGVPSGFGPTNPNQADSDADGFNDYIEVRYSSDPNSNAAKPGFEVAVVNGGFEEPLVETVGEAARVSSGTVPGWSVAENDFYVIRGFDFSDINNPASASEGLQFASADRRSPNPDVDASEFSNGIDSSMALKQEIDVSSLAAEIDAGTRTVLLDFDWRDNDTADEGVVTLEFLDGTGADLGNRSIFRTSGSAQQWIHTRHAGYPPVGTRTVRIIATARKSLSGPSSARNVFYDNFTARLVHFDADADGLPDPWELTYGLNPDDPSDAGTSADADGLSNLEEFLHGTNPTLADTDSDGFDDDDEVAAGSNPLDPASTPTSDEVKMTDFIVTRDASGQVTRVEIVFSGLNTGKTYKLVRSIDLVSFPTTVDTHQPVAATDSFVDENPPPGTASSRAFYRLEE